MKALAAVLEARTGDSRTPYGPFGGVRGIQKSRLNVEEHPLSTSLKPSSMVEVVSCAPFNDKIQVAAVKAAVDRMAQRKRGVYALVDDHMGFQFVRKARFDPNPMPAEVIIAVT